MKLQSVQPVTVGDHVQFFIGGVIFYEVRTKKWVIKVKRSQSFHLPT
jgi:hypothetical protein